MGLNVFILAGGFGTRLDFEGKLKTKPMVSCFMVAVVRQRTFHFKKRLLNLKAALAQRYIPLVRAR